RLSTEHPTAENSWIDCGPRRLGGDGQIARERIDPAPIRRLPGVWHRGAGACVDHWALGVGGSLSGCRRGRQVSIAVAARPERNDVSHQVEGFHLLSLL